MAGGQARLAEALAGLSLVTDLGLGQVQETTLRVSYLAGLLAERMQLGEEQRAELFYVGLMAGVGCTANGYELAAALGGDEIALKGALPAAVGDPIKVLRILGRHAGSGEPTFNRPFALARTLSQVGTIIEGLRAHCEVGAVLAERLGLSEEIQRGLLNTSESWNGRGIRRMRGEAIPLSVRVLTVALFGEVFYAAAGASAAQSVVRAQSGRFFDPNIANAFLDLVGADPPWSAFESPSLWDDVLNLEPVAGRVTIGDSQIDTVAFAFADFADLKAPYFVGHSRGVAILAEQAARRLRLPEEDIIRLRRASLTQDIGRAAIPNWILDRPRALSAAEWERIRLHPYYTERVLAKATPFASLAGLASSHHERLDGSGYHRGLRMAQLPIDARLLAAADVYQAVTENRAQRPGRPPDQAAALLRAQARSGLLDADCVEAVCEAARSAPPRRTRSLPGLSEREVEILRLLTRGHSKSAIARQLFISETTARHHVEHIYNKLGVSTRAGAVMQAVARGLAAQMSAEE